MPLTISNLNSPSVAALVNFLFSALDNVTISAPNPWPFAPDSLNFSAEGLASIKVDSTGKVSISFVLPGSPVLQGTLDFSTLESQIVTAPNYIQAINDNTSGRPGTMTGTTITFGGSYTTITKQRSGVMYVSAEIAGTQSAQDAVAVALYRDHGLAGEILLGSWFSVTPGGVSGFDWSGSLSTIDVLTDALPHSYTIVATGSGGSTLTVPQGISGSGAANIQSFEIGGPS